MLVNKNKSVSSEASIRNIALAKSTLDTLRSLHNGVLLIVSFSFSFFFVETIRNTSWCRLHGGFKGF